MEGIFVFFVCLKEAGLCTISVIGLFWYYQKGGHDDSHDGLYKKSITHASQKTHIKNITPYVNDCNYKLHCCSFPYKRNLEHWAVVHFMLSRGLDSDSGLLWFTFAEIQAPCTLIYVSTSFMRASWCFISLSTLHATLEYLKCLLRKPNLFIKIASVGKDGLKIFLLNIELACPWPQLGISSN